MKRFLCGAAALGLVLIFSSPGLAQSRRIPPGQLPKAIIETHTQPPFPPGLSRQGETDLSASLDMDGVPVDVKIVRSSSIVMLDEAAVSWVKAHWRWMPIPWDMPKVVPVRIIWVPPDAHRPAPIVETHTPPDWPYQVILTDQAGDVKLSVTVGVDGKVTKIAVAKSSGYPQMDDAAANWVKNHWLWEAGHPEWTGSVVIGLK